jgi:cyclophilin family peptidyl-prolyl cis-trans isomerase
MREHLHFSQSLTALFFINRQKALKCKSLRINTAYRNRRNSSITGRYYLNRNALLVTLLHQIYPGVRDARHSRVRHKRDIIALSKQRCKDLGAPEFTAEQREAYTTLGGTPFLDGQYTVFGEVTEGLDVVERIQACETLRGDRPKQDVSMTFELVEA